MPNYENTTRPALVRAIIEGDVKSVEKAILDGANVNAIVVGEHATPLTNAVQMAYENGNVELVRYLVQHGANPNKQNLDGTTALTWAETPAVTRILIDANALVSCEQPDDHQTSLHFAADAGDLERLQLLMELGHGERALESFDQFGRTPLSCAAAKGHVKCTEYLISKGSNVNAAQEMSIGQTPLQFALKERQVQTAKVLLESGANPELTIGLNTSPRDLAKYIGPDALALCPAWG